MYVNSRHRLGTFIGWCRLACRLYPRTFGHARGSLIMLHVVGRNSIQTDDRWDWMNECRIPCAIIMKPWPGGGKRGRYLWGHDATACSEGPRYWVRVKPPALESRRLEYNPTFSHFIRVERESTRDDLKEKRRNIPSHSSRFKDKNSILHRDSMMIWYSIRCIEFRTRQHVLVPTGRFSVPAMI